MTTGFVEPNGGRSRVKDMSSFLQRLRAFLIRRKQFRRVQVAGEYVLLTERQARRYDQLRRQQASSL